MIRFIATIRHPARLRPTRTVGSLGSQPGIVRADIPAGQAIRTATRAPSWGCLCRGATPEAEA